MLLREKAVAGELSPEPRKSWPGPFSIWDSSHNLQVWSQVEYQAIHSLSCGQPLDRKGKQPLPPFTAYRSDHHLVTSQGVGVFLESIAA